jgi:hypothetical protein
MWMELESDRCERLINYIEIGFTPPEPRGRHNVACSEMLQAAWLDDKMARIGQTSPGPVLRIAR